MRRCLLISNLRRLGVIDKVKLVSMALTDFRSVLQVLVKTQPDEIYNLAGQSSVGLSFDQPVETLESIATGTLNLLEAIRFMDVPVRFYNAGSGECFGQTSEAGADECSPFRPRSPYAVAKAAAFWEVANYRDPMVCLPVLASCLIMSLYCARKGLLLKRLSSLQSELLRVVLRSCG